MSKRLKIEYVPIKELKPYSGNAKEHPDWQIEQIKLSMQEFGNLDPIGIWKDEIVEGHGRLIAAMDLGYEEVPVIRLDQLTDQQRRAYAIVHNKLTMNTDFDLEKLQEELDALDEIEMDQYGFDRLQKELDWFEKRVRDDNDNLDEESEEYQEFVKKFEAAKTTDDCYTPDVVYEAVADWVEKTYGMNRKKFVRPFFPGGDYENAKYKPGDVVVDNPPFSILSEIVKFYSERKIKFFLFAPTLTLFSSSSGRCCALPVGASVTYENKASVNTSFLTNLESLRFRTAPDLFKVLQAAADEYTQGLTKELPKYSYPDYVITAARAAYFSKYGVDFRVPVESSQHIRALDAQKEVKKAIYGSAYLLSEKAAAEKAAAEKAAAEKAAATRWALSDREFEIIKSLK